jgi:hypothetical protein
MKFQIFSTFNSEFIEQLAVGDFSNTGPYPDVSEYTFTADPPTLFPI